MRTPFDVIEIQVDRCSLTYGTAPCQAALGVTGSAKCYNTFKTCQDADNFTQESESWYFCTPTSDLPKDQAFLPFLKSVSHSNGSIDPGQSLGVRSSVSVQLMDAQHHDRTFDRYASERTAAGTFFGRLRARWPYYYGRVLNWYSGFLGQSLAEMDKRTYVIEKMTWGNGRVSITAKDPLKLADNDRAKAPRPSEGTLVSDLATDANPTTLDIYTPEPTEYDDFRVVLIGSELIQYTGTTPITDGVQLTGVTRAAPSPYITERDDHEAGDSVQACLFYEQERAIDVVYDLLANYADIPTTYLPLAEWETEYQAWLPGLLVTRLIHEPEGVRDLLEELIPQTMSTYWWDERQQKVRYRAVRPLEPEAEPPQLTDASHIVDGSLDISDAPEEQYNEIHVWYGQLNPAEDADEVTNYRKVLVIADLDSQSALAENRKKILTVYANWHPTSNSGRVTQMARRTIATRVQVPRVITLELDAKDIDDLWTGDVADLTSLHVQGVDGAAETLRVQVTRVRAQGKGKYEYRLREDFFLGNYFRLAPSALAGVSFFDGTAEQQDKYGALTDTNGLLSDGSEGRDLL